jgi:hypothetical protein
VTAEADWGQRLTDAGITTKQLRQFAEALGFAAVLAETGQIGTPRLDANNFTAAQWEVLREYMDAIRRSGA